MQNEREKMLTRIVRMTSNIFLYISAGLLVVMLFLGTGDVLGRYLFNRPITGTIEVYEILLPAIVLLSLAYTQLVKAHIKVDLFSSRLPLRARVIVDFVTTAWAFALFAIIGWRGIIVVIFQHDVGRVITNIGVPMYLPRLLVPVGALAICLVLVSDLIDDMNKIRRRG